MSDRDAFRANRDAELKTPDEWCVELGIEILDPDGWRGKNGRPWTDPITRKEFGTRSIISTQRRVTPADRAEMQAARAAGLKARHETREARAVRKQVAEEIAKACDARCLAITESSSSGLTLNELWTVVGLARGWDLASKLAREIGSRDPA